MLQIANASLIRPYGYCFVDVLIGNFGQYFFVRLYEFRKDAIHLLAVVIQSADKPHWNTTCAAYSAESGNLVRLRLNSQLRAGRRHIQYSYGAISPANIMFADCEWQGAERKLGTAAIGAKIFVIRVCRKYKKV